MAPTSKSGRAPITLPKPNTAARPSVSGSSPIPQDLTSHSQADVGLSKRPMDVPLDQINSDAVSKAPVMTELADQGQKQIGVAIDTISQEFSSPKGVSASLPLSLQMPAPWDDPKIAPTLTEPPSRQPLQRRDPLFTDGLPDEAMALVWSLIPAGEQSRSSSKTALMKHLPAAIDQMRLDLEQHLHLQSQGRPHGNVSKMSEQMAQTAKWLAAKEKLVTVSQHQQTNSKVSLTPDQPSSSSRLQGSSQTGSQPPSPYAQPDVVRSTPVTKITRPPNSLSGPSASTSQHTHLSASPPLNYETVERAWTAALDDVASHMQSAW